MLVVEDVALLVGRGDGLLDRDRLAVDLDGDVAGEVVGGHLVHPDQTPLEVAGEEALLAFDDHQLFIGRHGAHRDLSWRSFMSDVRSFMSDVAKMSASGVVMTSPGLR